MGHATTPLVDSYSAYDYKPAFREGHAGQAPTWVDKDNRRRLAAYILLRAYLENTARSYLVNDEDAEARREYGDANLIVETLVDAVLGEDARVMVRGANRTTEPDEYADTLQEWVDKWVEDALLHMTVMEVEEDAVGLGDGLFVLGWDARGRQVSVTCYDPGFYFPVIDPRVASNDYPTKVHIAWEYEDTISDPVYPKKYIRRITYELVELQNGETRSYPWRSEPSTTVCLKSDGTWSWESMGSRNYLDLDEGTARWEVNAEGVEVRNLDIGVDFIPVVHLPNTVSRKEHFGKSALKYVLQILDDVQSADTDLLKSARTTGSPPLGSDSVVETDEDGEVKTYGPGQIIQGKITVIDTSRNLDALLKYLEFLLKRLSTNIRMPESVLGKLRPSEVPSGVALALSFGPLRSLVRRMRLARHEKYPLLFKFAHRFTMLDDAHADLRPSADRVDDIPLIEYSFGQFLPSDTTTIITDIMNLFERQLISRQTAIRLLIEDAGMSIREAADEVTQIEERDFEGANRLREALDSPEAASEYLGIEIPPMSEARQQQFQMETEAAIEQAKARGFGQPSGNDNNGQGQNSDQNGQRQPANQE